jgi:hypothetical protein
MELHLPRPQEAREPARKLRDRGGTVKFVRGLWLLAIAACGSSHHKTTDASLVDSAVDAATGTCTTLAVHDTFDAGQACQTWGYAFIDDSGGLIDVASGQLAIKPGANAPMGASHIGCATTAPVDFTMGAFVQVTTAPTMTEYMELYAGTVMVEWRPTLINASHNDLGTTTFLAATAFDTTTTWVRITPNADSTGTDVQTSGDGYTWTTFATDPVMPPAMASIEVDGGTRSPDPAPPPILFDGLNVCPL